MRDWQPRIIMVLDMSSVITIFVITPKSEKICSPLKRYLYTSFLFFFGMSMMLGVGVFPRWLEANSTPGKQALTCSTAAELMTAA